jgi:hypothetical protein
LHFNTFQAAVTVFENLNYRTMNKKDDGLSLDAIFAQRGIEVDKMTLKEGEVYLFDQKGHFDWDWIGRVANTVPLYDLFIHLKEHISSDGRDCRGGGIYSRDVTAIYKATPDQIDLLESFKQQEGEEEEEEEDPSDLRRRIEAAIPTEIRGVNCPHRMVPVFTHEARTGVRH